MAELTLPGNNTLTLCGAALCAIVEKHINEAAWPARDKAPVRVSYAAAKADGGATVFTFQVTTDLKEPSNG